MPGKNRFGRRSLLRASAVALLVGCSTCDEGVPRREVCGNDIDDDGDQLADCMDSECAMDDRCRIPADGDADLDDDSDRSDASPHGDGVLDGDTGPDAEEDAAPDAAPVAVCDPTSGEERYAFVVDALDTCVDHSPVWQQLYWVGITPEGTSIEFLGRTAESESALAEATEFQIAVSPPASSPANLETALAAAGIDNGQRLFELTSVLRCAGVAEPAELVDIALLHDCD
jgi:hypothetical protein